MDPMVDPIDYTAAELGLGGLVKSSGHNGEQATPLRSIWLEAFNDPVAGITACTPCVHTCNLFGDGDNRLVIAEEDRKLKVWKGTQKASEFLLLDTPVAICSYISENTAPRLPALAVAAGSNIFIYRNLRPCHRFQLPPENVNTEEQDVWQKVMDGEIVIGEAVAQLTRLQDAGEVLHTRSLQLMKIGDMDAKMAFVKHWQGQPLVRTTVITCMDVVKQAIDEPDAVSCLVVGTESGRILILNAAGDAIVKNIWVGSTPAMIAVQGELDVEYRITVAGRDGKLYHIRNGELTQTIIQLEAQPVGLVPLLKHVAVGCMNDVIHAYQPTGHKSWSIYLPAHILAMQRMEVAGQCGTKALLVALANGEVRVYNEELLVSVHSVPNPVTALWFGRYGREDNTLLAITKSGALDIKVRVSPLLPTSAVFPSPPLPAWPGRHGSEGVQLAGWWFAATGMHQLAIPIPTRPSSSSSPACPSSSCPSLSCPSSSCPSSSCPSSSCPPSPSPACAPPSRSCPAPPTWRWGRWAADRHPSSASMTGLQAPKRPCRGIPLQPRRRHPPPPPQPSRRYPGAQCGVLPSSTRGGRSCRPPSPNTPRARPCLPLAARLRIRLDINELIGCWRCCGQGTGGGARGATCRRLYGAARLVTSATPGDHAAGAATAAGGEGAVLGCGKGDASCGWWCAGRGTRGPGFQWELKSRGCRAKSGLVGWVLVSVTE
ncbi:hypothetical protein Agub_g9403 [Astrephomene gubernaculifera]|uniref:Bardet-Biedl syndrome 1 N-terminal domain-containing protein n=1 Tax=Astrephomene gubernaculifera TaxID=47775 RepID=A0AAD3HPA3_9CHLO|nr:hypothetical protein Agub_g9403 [Astrephomene gubernaculifera]